MKERHGDDVHAAAVSGIGTTIDGHVDKHEGSGVMVDVLAGLEIAESRERQTCGARQVEMGALRGLQRGGSVSMRSA